MQDFNHQQNELQSGFSSIQPWQQVILDFTEDEDQGALYFSRGSAPAV